MAYTPPPSPSSKADVSNRSGHSFLLSPDLTIYNTAFQSLPAGCAAPGGETHHPSCSTQPCCLSTRTPALKFLQRIMNVAEEDLVTYRSHLLSASLCIRGELCPS